MMRSSLDVPLAPKVSDPASVILSSNRLASPLIALLNLEFAGKWIRFALKKSLFRSK